MNDKLSQELADPARKSDGGFLVGENRPVESAGRDRRARVVEKAYRNSGLDGFSVLLGA